jgi:hypothetical protein
VLVLFTSAGVAVTLAARRAGQRKRTYAFAAISLIFLYTTISNVIERPDGVKIGACFVLAIVAVSIASRIKRVFELRATEIEFDAASQVFVRDCARRTIRLVANQAGERDVDEYVEKLKRLRRDHDLPVDPDVIFVEVTVVDPSDFEGRLHVRGEVRCQRYRVMSVTAPSVPNALAALALRIRDDTGAVPHVYFEWTEGNPVHQFLRFLLFGSGEVAPITHEVLRRAEPDLARRPRVHVG